MQKTKSSIDHLATHGTRTRSDGRTAAIGRKLLHSGEIGMIGRVRAAFKKWKVRSRLLRLYTWY